MANMQIDWPGRERSRELVSAQYPWGEWFNGAIWHLVHGVDFAVPKHQFQLQAHSVARQMGYKIRTTSQYKGNDIWIQAL